MKRPAYFISDSTGITVESLGASLLAQFQNIRFDITIVRYADSEEKVRQTTHQINQHAREAGVKPVVFSTLVNGQYRAILQSADAHVIDFMGTFITPLEEILSAQASPSLGITHGQRHVEEYENRMDAVNYALQNDDGVSTHHYDQADIILLGVSRSGKTPTCVYLAMQYGVYAANYPLVEEDLDMLKLPDAIAQHHKKLFGLVIDAERLHMIRQARRPDSVYSSLAQCQHELREVRNLYREYNIPVIDATRMSVEEIATHILVKLKSA
jgi:regulator of PEP synthase PpsR (kinase-PPPase family)